MQDAEKASRTLVINDWFHETSDEIALRLVATNDSMRPLCASSVLFDGMGSVQCPARVAGLDSFGCVSMEAMTASSGSGQYFTMWKAYRWHRGDPMKCTHTFICFDR